MRFQILFCILIFLTVAVSGSAQTEQNPEDRITPALERQLSAAKAGARLDAYVVFGPRLVIADHLKVVQGMAPDDRRKYAIELLKNHARGNWQTAEAYLESMEATGAAAIRSRIWLNGVISFTATARVIRDVAGMPNVLYVHFDARTKAEEVEDGRVVKAVPAPKDGILPTHITTANADEVWDLGYRGENVLVAIIDGRVNYNHPDLSDHIWTNTGETPGNGVDDDGNGFIDDTLGWDFISNDNDPVTTSANSHGTAVAGIVGGDGTSGICTGLAPEVELMPLAVSSSTHSAYWSAYQYAVDMGAHVISSSSTLKWPSQPDYASFRQATDAELLAGVIHSNSTGNQGEPAGQDPLGVGNNNGDQGEHPIPFNVGAPGNCPPPWLHPDQTLRSGISAVMGAGAMATAQSNAIANSSGRGPVAWVRQDATDTLGSPYPTSFLPYGDYLFDGGNSMGLIKPDVTAPSNGGMVTTNNDYLNGSPGAFYDSFSGTSGAQPVLAGLMCLMLSVDPTLSPEVISQIIQETATDFGDPGKDNVFGAGRIDCLAAVQAVIARFGTLAPNDVIMSTNATTLASNLTLLRENKRGLFVSPVPVDGNAFPTSLGNSSIEHVDNTTYVLVGSGTAPFGVYLLDFSAGATTPTSRRIGLAAGPVNDIEYDAASGNAYLVAGTGVRAITGPIGPDSTVTPVNIASPGIVFSSLAVEGTGNQFLGGTSTAVFRFCAGEFGATLLFNPIAGMNGLDTNRLTGDIFVNSFGSDRIDRYTSAGIFMDTILSDSHVDGSCDVEYNAANDRVYTVGRNGAQAQICIFGTCVNFPIGVQPGDDNAVVAASVSGGGLTPFKAVTLLPHRNTGSVANIAVVKGTLFDPSFESQVATQEPRAPWVNSVGTANVIETNLLLCPIPGLNDDGDRRLVLLSEGSDDATPPAGATGPLGVSRVTTQIVFDPEMSILEMSLVFLSGEGTNQATFNDFGGAFISGPSGGATLALMDTFSNITGTTGPFCGPTGADVVAQSVAVNLAQVFPNAERGEVLTLTLFCGNAQDDAITSRLYVDNIRLSPTGFRLDVGQPGPFQLQFGYTGAVPGSQVVMLFTLNDVTCPRDTGPIIGMSLGALGAFQFPQSPPVFTFANGAGSFSQTVGGIPPGLTLEFRSVEFAGGFPSRVSNLVGPLYTR